MVAAPSTRTQLAIALDFQNAARAMEIVKALEPVTSGPLGGAIIYKVGLELFAACGPSLVRDLKARGARVFLDLKLYDIPNTVAKAALSAAEIGADFLTVHLSGGSQMFEAIRKDLATHPKPPMILGVSVLTSFSEQAWNQTISQLVAAPVQTQISKSVESMVAQASGWGCGGIVCSAFELQNVRKSHPGLFTMVPGIRPAGSAAGDQSRVMTPAQAAALGAHAIVVGRPITESSDPRATTEQILKELA